MTAIVPRPGPPGPPGAGSDATYLHQQLTPSATWTIDHNLGKEPAVTVIDSADSEVVGDVTYPTLNRVVITFGAAFGGRATAN